jgi:hypothetical protein
MLGAFNTSRQPRLNINYLLFILFTIVLPIAVAITSLHPSQPSIFLVASVAMRIFMPNSRLPIQFRYNFLPIYHQSP